MTQRILADPYTTTSIEYGDELKFVSTAPLTNGTDGVFKAVEQWKGEDFARAFKLKGFRAAWEKLVQPGKASINKIHAFFQYYRLAYTCLNVAHEIVVRWKPEQDGMSHNRVTHEEDAASGGRVLAAAWRRISRAGLAAVNRARACAAPAAA